MPFVAAPDSVFCDEYSEFGALLELLDWRLPWHADALCQEYSGRVTWFPGQNQSPVGAQKICARCLVRDECAAWALDQGPELQGVWGGLSQRDRARIRGGRQAA